MEELRAYDVDFIGLTPEGETRHYVADDAWFQAVGGTEAQQGNVEVDVKIQPLKEGFDLGVSFKGTVCVACDRCLEPMLQPVQGATTLRVKLGAVGGDDGDIITVAESDGTLNIAWNLYEQIVLAIPMRHVHDYECAKIDPSPEGDRIDPRWEALRGLTDRNNS